jgi:hypothetical protein
LIAFSSALGCSESVDKSPPHVVTPRVVVGDIPCAPNQVLKNVCQHCHTDPPQHGAPFPLVTFSNVHAEMDGHEIWYWMEKYVTAEIMPLPPVEISDADRALLLAWLRAGAPARGPNDSCDGDAGGADADDRDAGAGIGDTSDAPLASHVPPTRVLDAEFAPMQPVPTHDASENEDAPTDTEADAQ